MSRKPVRTLLIAGLLAGQAALGSEVLAEPTALPQPQGRVNDFAAALDPAARAQLQKTIDQLERDTGAEIAVVTTQDAGEQTPKQLAGALFDEWGVGKRDKNNGLLLLLALKQRRIETEVGYGLEQVLTDSVTTQVLEQTAVPHLKQRDYGAALVAATSRFADLIRNGAQSGAVGALVPERPAGAAVSEPDASAIRGSGVTLRNQAPQRPGQPLRPPTRAARPALLFERAFASNWVAVLAVALAILGYQLSLGFRRRFPGPLFYLLGLGFAAVLVVLAVAQALSMAALFLGVAVGASTIAVGLGLARHRCPWCEQWMTIETVRTRQPTSSTAGEKQRTYRCSGCDHHDVEILEFSRPSQFVSNDTSWTGPDTSFDSSSSSSSSSSSDTESFGGGSSGGHGGGASW